MADIYESKVTKLPRLCRVTRNTNIRHKALLQWRIVRKCGFIAQRLRQTTERDQFTSFKVFLSNLLNEKREDVTRIKDGK